MTTIHARFFHFICKNLDYMCPEYNNYRVYELYDDFSKLKWEGTDYQSLLSCPDEIPKKAYMFLQLMEQSEKEHLSWFIVGRQVQLSDSTFQRCLNMYKSRFLNVTLPNKYMVDLGVLDYLEKMNNTQLRMRLPRPKPCISAHTARLMRELWLLKREHKLPYKLRSDDKQICTILKKWFNDNYTIKCEDGKIGYPRRQLLEEANCFLVGQFGDCKVLYCHAAPWRWFMKHVIGIDDNVQRGHYLRLPVWKKDQKGKPILNKRKSVGTGGEFSLEKRVHNRLKDRNATEREKDAARKARDNKNKKRKKDY